MISFECYVSTFYNVVLIFVQEAIKVFEVNKHGSSWVLSNLFLYLSSNQKIFLLYK